jgi:hypothetical protein
MSNPILAMRDPVWRRATVAHVQAKAMSMLLVPLGLSHDHGYMPPVTSWEDPRLLLVAFVACLLTILVIVSVRALLQWALPVGTSQDVSGSPTSESEPTPSPSRRNLKLLPVDSEDSELGPSVPVPAGPSRRSVRATGSVPGVVLSEADPESRLATVGMHDQLEAGAPAGPGPGPVRVGQTPLQDRDSSEVARPGEPEGHSEGHSGPQAEAAASHSTRTTRAAVARNPGPSESAQVSRGHGADSDCGETGSTAQAELGALSLEAQPLAMPTDSESRSDCRELEAGPGSASTVSFVTVPRSSDLVGINMSPPPPDSEDTAAASAAARGLRVLAALVLTIVPYVPYSHVSARA